MVCNLNMSVCDVNAIVSPSCTLFRRHIYPFTLTLHTYVFGLTICNQICSI